MTKLPTLFISHGSPMTALEPREAGAFMQQLGPAVTAAFGPPRALLMISAHSLARQPTVLAGPVHHAVYDFSGFDPQLLTLRYDAPGAPALAQKVMALLQGAGLPAQQVQHSGLDHGIWTPLRYMFPAADMPVLPLAWPADWSPARLFELGQALAPLAAQGVLIVASGSITHNLQRVFGSPRVPPVDQPATPESSAFRDWFAARASVADWSALWAYRTQAPHAQLMHPTDEHLLPWFVAAGAGAGAGAGSATRELAGSPPNAPGLRIHASLTFGDLGMDAYAFGSSAPALQAVLQAAVSTTPQGTPGV